MDRRDLRCPGRASKGSWPQSPERGRHCGLARGEDGRGGQRVLGPRALLSATLGPAGRLWSHCPQRLGAGMCLPEELSVTPSVMSPVGHLGTSSSAPPLIGNHFLEMLSEAKGCYEGQREGS